MFRNYFKTAWRNIRKDRGYSVLNILGLAVGMAVALVIGLWFTTIYHTIGFCRNSGRLIAP